VDKGFDLSLIDKENHSAMMNGLKMELNFGKKGYILKYS